MEDELGRRKVARTYAWAVSLVPVLSFHFRGPGRCRSSSQSGLNRPPARPGRVIRASSNHCLASPGLPGGTPQAAVDRPIDRSPGGAAGASSHSWASPYKKVVAGPLPFIYPATS